MGMPLVVGNTIADTFFMIKHMIRFDLQKIKHKIKNSEIKKSNLETIRKYFDVKQEKILNFKDISIQLREDLDIMNQI
jgi:hypothetical protein